MALFHFKVLDRSKRVLATNQFDEADATSACRAATIAATIFCFGQGICPGGSIEIDDDRGEPIGIISLDLKLL